MGDVNLHLESPTDKQLFVAAGDEQSRTGRPVTDTHSWTSTRCRRCQVRFYGDVRQRVAARPV